MKKKKEDSGTTYNDYFLKKIQQNIKNGCIKYPTRFFKIGDQVKIDALKNTIVTEVLFDGYAYKCHYDFMGESYGQPNRKVGDISSEWTSVFPMSAFQDGEILHNQDDIRIVYSNADISSLLHLVYSSGVDFNPDYQRDLIWTQEQKVSLIGSIFNGIEIGKFAFVKHDYSRELFYEILDGKQRLSTICEFYEDRFTWKGKKFTELCFRDASFFTLFPIVRGETSQLTQQQIYKLFVKMNTSGTPIDQKHLERIKALIQ